ncbi:hypothetical protein [Clostridium massiliamazoniense]|uniref:hypothetical protein n=1 Tax=Clostridium massiliamazoniense TaxID=1347366 RepID=UPI0006D84262|nr:hypothetical protein [Clostridium massiliamazoniense]
MNSLKNPKGVFMLALVLFGIIFIMSLINASYITSICSILFIIVIGINLSLNKFNISEKSRKVISNILMIIILILLAIVLYSMFDSIHIIRLKNNY